MLLRKRVLVLITIALFIILVLLISLFLNKNQYNAGMSPSFLEPADSTQGNISCKHEGESICINPLICPDNKDKCCKGLFAVIETKSNAVCQTPSESNANKPRVKNLEY